MAQSYVTLLGGINNLDALDQQMICRVHSEIMRHPFTTPSKAFGCPGITRASTGEKVVIGVDLPIQCCPYNRVDEEVDTIIRIAKVVFGLLNFGLPIPHRLGCLGICQELEEPVCRLSLVPLCVNQLPPF